MVSVATSFYQSSANHVSFYLLFNLRNLLYLIVGSFDSLQFQQKKEAPYTGSFLFWLGWRDSNPRDAGVKVLCLTAWRQPKIHCHNRQKIKIWKRGLSISLKGLFLLGWVMRVELMISRATICRPNQLGHTHHMARQEGLEPPTYCLEGSCSIQLSYWRRSWSG